MFKRSLLSWTKSSALRLSGRSFALRFLPTTPNAITYRSFFGKPSEHEDPFDELHPKRLRSLKRYPRKNENEDEDEEDEEDEDEQVYFCEEEPHMFSTKIGLGYNPLQIGDHLTERSEKGRVYEVVRKLGYGTTSSTWLVRSSPTNPHFLALKVLTVTASRRNFNNENEELRSSLAITERNPAHPGYAHCLPLRDYTVSNSRHGAHMALAFDVMGSSIDTVQATQSGGALTPPLVRRVVKQVLLALEYMHVECGLVHSDVRPTNIMVPLTASDATIAEYVSKHHVERYPPRSEPEVSPEPIVTIKSQPFPDLGLHPSLDNLSVKLCDYGQAIPIKKADGADRCWDTHPLLRSPEVILGHPWSTPVDIWSVGCIAFELLSESSLFVDHDDTPRFTANDVNLQRMIQYTGDFAPEFLRYCTRREEYFDDFGDLLRVEKLPYIPLEKHVTGVLNSKHVSDADASSAAGFIKRCLALDPAARPSATELLQDDWLRDA